MYGKIENGVLICAPKSVVIDDRRIINPGEEILKKLGFLPVEEEKEPEAEEGYAASSFCEREGDRIVKRWRIEKLPTREPTPTERLSRLERIIDEWKSFLSFGGQI